MSFISNLMRKSVPAPDLSWLIQASTGLKNTPDIFYLTQRQTHLLFVYDRLKTGHKDHEIIKDFAELRVRAAFTQPTYSLWRKNLMSDSFPILLRAQGTKGFHLAPPLAVHGELFEIHTSKLIELDKLKENGVVFSRRRIPLKVPYRNVTTINGWNRETLDKEFEAKKITILTEPYQASVYAWTYMGSNKYWEPLLDGGYTCSPVKVYTPNKNIHNKYYNFTINEYETEEDRRLRKERERSLKNV